MQHRTDQPERIAAERLAGLVLSLFVFGRYRLIGFGRQELLNVARA
jgi:hypothetical protein